jgi:polyisoprenyl-phosphate glycosyltransferase
MSTVEYSVVIPVHNSAPMLHELLQRIEKVFMSMNKSFETILIDDASTDNSWQVLQSLKEANPKTAKIIQLSRNYGQHSATLCGIRFCTGRYVITMDDDLQHRPEDIPLLIEKMQSANADVVYGTAQSNSSAAYRRTGSSAWKFFARSLKLGYGDGSSFRLIKMDVASKIAQHTQHFVFIDQLLYWYTQHTALVKVEHLPRSQGRSGYSPARLFFLTSNLLIFYTTLPLKLMTYSGILLSIASLLLALYFIIKKVFMQVNVEGFTALMVTILFATSIMLICFGIIGEYLGRIYSLLSDKPTYSIRESRL